MSTIAGGVPSTPIIPIVNTSGSAPTPTAKQMPGLSRPKPRLNSKSSDSSGEWVANSLLVAKTVAAAAECAPFPYLKGAFGVVVVLLETVEKVQKNREGLRDLCENSVAIIAIVRDEVALHGETAAVRFKGRCDELERLLQDIVDSVKQMQQSRRGCMGRIKEVLKMTTVADQIEGYRMGVQELRSNFSLMAGIDTNFIVQDTNATVKKIQASLTAGVLSNNTVVSKHFNNCPPPSRIFQGRVTILDKMHQDIRDDSKKQHILLLHGLGGVGKTQIAFKFIDMMSSHFSDVFLIDASTLGTIESGFKRISAAKHAGSTAQDALQWLKNTKEQWLLFFDNADDPTINLNNFLPRCNHGNILITSRNPALRVYAQESSSAVSDMGETDAVELLLKSAAEDLTPGNRTLAEFIVKELGFLPLAIVQAGAYIAKSRDLQGYLTLYQKNRRHMLSEKPPQSHDDYAWTVYTTWQISFARLSKPAAEFLQLCSLIHHKGISEEMFCHARVEEIELGLAVDFLAQFSDPTGVWNHLRFMEMTTELGEYSLLNFDPTEKAFSVHPLVHSWAESLLADPKGSRNCMITLIGMSFKHVPDDHKFLASIKLMPHVQLLLAGVTELPVQSMDQYKEIFRHGQQLKEAEKLALRILDERKGVRGEDDLDTLAAMHSLAWIYLHRSKFKEAEMLEEAVFQKRKEHLGDVHIDTLLAMGLLGSIYRNLGQLKKAENIQVEVLEKYRVIQGEDHLGTLSAMHSLVWTYLQEGKAQEAEKLESVVLEKRTKLLGDNHPDTLTAMRTLGSTYRNLGQLAKAESLQLAVVDRQRGLRGEDNLETLNAMHALAWTYLEQGKAKEAEKLQVVVLEKRKKLLGDDHQETLLAMVNLASTYNKQGHLDEAEKLRTAVVEKQRGLLGDDHLVTLTAITSLAATYFQRQKLDKAKTLQVEVLDKRRQLLGDGHPDTQKAKESLDATLKALRLPDAGNGSARSVLVQEN